MTHHWMLAVIAGLVVFLVSKSSAIVSIDTCNDQIQALRSAFSSSANSEIIVFNCYGVISLTAPLSARGGLSLTIDGENKVTLDGGGFRAFEFTNPNAGLILKNIVIQNCHGNGAATTGGGAVLVTVAAALNFSGVTFRNNSSPSTGGAISAGTNSGPHTFSGCRFLYNEAADHGSAIFGDWQTSITISQSTFAYNRVLPSAAGKGGVIVIHTAVLQISSSLFAFNSAPEFGVIYNLLSNTYVTSSSFWGNFAGGGSVLSVDGGNSYLGPMGVIDLRDTILAENTANRRGSAILLCLYAGGSHPETSTVTDHAFLRNISFCRNRFTGVAGSPSWGQGAIDSQCNGNNVTHFFDTHWNGNRGLMGDADILAGSLSIEGTAPLLWDSDAATVLPTTTTDGLARACNGFASLNQTLLNAMVIPTASPPVSSTPVGTTVSQTPTTPTPTTPSATSSSTDPGTTSPLTSTTSSPTGTTATPPPTKPTTSAPPTAPGSISVPLNACLSDSQTLELRKAIDLFLNTTGTTLVVLCGDGSSITTAVLLPAASSGAQASVFQSAVSSNEFQTSQAALDTCALTGCGVTPFGVPLPLSITPLPTSPSSPSSSSAPLPSTRPPKSPSPSSSNKSLSKFVIIGVIVGVVLLLVLLVVVGVIMYCCVCAADDRIAPADLRNPANWGPTSRAQERYAMELYPADSSGYTASPLHTPAAPSLPVASPFLAPVSHVNPPPPASLPPAPAMRALPPSTIPPPPHLKPTAISMSSKPIPPPTGLTEPTTIERVRPPPNTMRHDEEDEDEDDEVFAPTVASVAAVSTLVPPPKPRRPPPERGEAKGHQSTMVSPPHLSQLNLYADDE